MSSLKHKTHPRFVVVICDMIYLCTQTKACDKSYRLFEVDTALNTEFASMIYGRSPQEDRCWCVEIKALETSFS